MQLKVKVLNVDNVVRFFGQKYPRLIAAEAGRVIKRQRLRTAEDIAKTVVTRGLLSSQIKVPDVKKRIWFEPKSTRVTTAELKNGIGKSLSISNKRLNAWAARGTPTVKKKKGARSYYVVHTTMFGRTRPEMGGFWVYKKKWRAAIRGGKAVLLMRPEYPNEHGTFPAKEHKRHFKTIMGPSFAGVLRKAGLERPLADRARQRYQIDMYRAIIRLGRAIQSGSVPA